jgi:hypothetical protein
MSSYCCDVYYVLVTKLGMADLGAGVGGGVGAGQVGQGRPATHWTPVMSGFVLHHFAELVGEGVKTDKGFKEVHVNMVARQVSEFPRQEVTGTWVLNHSRKWRQRWVRVCKLKDICEALWDEDNCSIVLAEEHLLGYTKVSCIFAVHPQPAPICYPP